MTEPVKKESSMRWWEFYAVRYAMGTVVGAIIFYLLCQANPILQPLLLEVKALASSTAGASAPTSLDATRLTLLTAYGLVYCYIASAPILVFHACRFLIKLDTPFRIKLKWTVICLFVPAVAAIVTYICVRADTDRMAVFVGSVFTLALILWLQVVVVYRTLVQNSELYIFYVKLSARREKATGEITDSYRHLREHGNSFFIVFLEVVLAVVMFGAGMLTSASSGAWIHLWILITWILPAVFVWMIGTLFERRFSDDEQT